MQYPTPSHSRGAWALQDAKAQFSAVVDGALRGVPQHVLRRGKPSVVVLSEHDFEMLKNSAAKHTNTPISFVDHLLAQPKMTGEGMDLETGRLELQPRDFDFHDPA